MSSFYCVNICMKATGFSVIIAIIVMINDYDYDDDLYYFFNTNMTRPQSRLRCY